MTSVTKAHKAKAAKAATKISHNPLLALAPTVFCMACKPPGFVVAADETCADMLFATSAHLIVLTS